MNRLRKTLAVAGTTVALAFALAGGAGAAIGPGVQKVFVDPNSPSDPSPVMALHGVAAVLFGIVNVNTDTALTNVSFTDTLPAGLIVADNVPADKIINTNDCPGGTPGTITAVAGSNTITLTGATIAKGVQGDPDVTPGVCSIVILISSTSIGSKTNTFTANSDQGASIDPPGSDTITVFGPPTIAKQFGSPSVKMAPNGTTTMTFTLSNPNSEALTGVQFTDPLPGIVVAPTPGVSNTCGGTFTAAAGATQVSLATGTIPANGSCQISVNITGSVPGPHTNETTPVTATNGGVGNQATANILVIAPPLVLKQFNAPTMALSGLSAASFVMVNINPQTTLTGVGFTDNLPAGLVVANQAPVVQCTGSNSAGTITAVAGSSTITVSGGTLAPAPPDSNCVVTVFLNATSAGTKVNTFFATSVEGGPGASASATIRVLSPPTLTKSFASAFNPASVALNQSTTLTFTMTNPNPTDDLTGVQFVDDMRAPPDNIVYLVVSLPDNGATGNLCGGTLTAPPGSPALLIEGATIPANSSCTFSVSVTGVLAGTENNTTGPILSENGGPGLSAAATLYVVAPPVIAKAFTDVKIVHNTSTRLTFTVANPPENTIPLTGVSFVDVLPPGLVLSPTNVTSGSCGGGSISAQPFTTVIGLSNATLPVNTTCTFSVEVIGMSIGEFTNVTTVTSANGGIGNTASASLVVVPQIIPTLQGWALILLGVLLSLSAAAVFARRTRN
jgi:hypothetical protein